MKYRLASFLLGGSMLAATGCLHPTFGEFNNNTSIVPPIGKFTGHNTLPPAQMLMHPGPGVDGPGPGVLMNGAPGGGDPGIMQASFMGPAGACGCGPGGPGGPGGCMIGDGGAMAGGGGYGMGMGMINASSQIAFVGPDGLSVTWDVSQPGAFDSEPLIAPGRYNFPQGAIYRLKLTNVPGRPGVELYPTLEVGPATPRTEAYLAHNAIPVQFTEEDFDQILSGNFVTKVIYLPDAEFQELALAGVETLVSTRLDPGVDPIVEADRRGSILAITRVGNKDLEIPSDPGVAAGGGAGGGVAPAGYVGGCGPGGGCPMGTQGGIPMPPEFVAGVTSPQYGMPYVGTPIGLPGPPHIPLGHPAGLQKHIMTNNTKIHMPPPTKKLHINVKQKPGFSYPKPPSHVFIEEHAHVPPVKFHQPFSDKHEFQPDCGEDCPCPQDCAEDCPQ
jgi:hypothetical protein